MKVLINLQWCKGCGVCVAFCRSGALSLDGDGKPEYAPALCVGCGLCAKQCKFDAITGALKEKHRVDAQKCVGCGLCAQKCPRKCIQLV